MLITHSNKQVLIYLQWKVLASIGVEIPLQNGWMHKLVGVEIPDEIYNLAIQRQSKKKKVKTEKTYIKDPPHDLPDDGSVPWVE